MSFDCFCGVDEEFSVVGRRGGQEGGVVGLGGCALKLHWNLLVIIIIYMEIVKWMKWLVCDKDILRGSTRDHLLLLY